MTTPEAQKTLPKEALDQIAEIRSLVAAGTIPPQEGDRLVAKVVEKWTSKSGFGHVATRAAHSSPAGTNRHCDELTRAAVGATPGRGAH